MGQRICTMPSILNLRSDATRLARARPGPPATVRRPHSSRLIRPDLEGVLC